MFGQPVPSFTSGGDVTTLEDTSYSAAWASGMNANQVTPQAVQPDDPPEQNH